MQLLRRYLKIISTVTAISLAGYSGTLAFSIQAFAWARMTEKNLKQDALGSALRKTFDGKHPCEICKHLRVARAKQSRSRQNSEPRNGASSFHPVVRWSTDEDPLVDLTAHSARGSRATARFGEVRNECPPTPPPRMFEFS